MIETSKGNLDQGTAMGMTITLPPELERKAQREAKRRGQDVRDYIIGLVEEAVSRPSKTPTLDELLAPLREDFARSGMTEEQLNTLIEEERQALWEEKHGRRD